MKINFDICSKCKCEHHYLDSTKYHACTLNLTCDWNQKYFDGLRESLEESLHEDLDKLHNKIFFEVPKKCPFITEMVVSQ